MTFGKYRGELLCDIPTGYLRWLREVPDLNYRLREGVQAELQRREKAYSHQADSTGTGSRSLVDVRAVIRKWYCELSLRWHPDRGGCTEAMQAINDAKCRLEKLLEVGIGR
jgi:hypothetical protein